MSSVLPTSKDCGPESSEGFERLLPPKLLRLLPENPPVVPPRDDDERPELRLLDPLRPADPPLELVEVRPEEVPDLPAAAFAPST